jgi:adenylate kinase family enzyme
VQRVAIIGSGGSGKSALARQLGAITGLPVIHLDHHYWGPGWVPTPDGQWRDRVRSLLAGDRWIADGNYGGTLDLRADLADTVVLVDLPRRVCLSRALRRLRSPILQAPGCPQKADLAFLRWIWTFPRRTRPRMLQIVESHAPDVDLVVLRNGVDIRAFLSRVRRGPDAEGRSGPEPDTVAPGGAREGACPPRDEMMSP